MIKHREKHWGITITLIFFLVIGLILGVPLGYNERGDVKCLEPIKHETIEYEGKQYICEPNVTYTHYEPYPDLTFVDEFNERWNCNLHVPMYEKVENEV
jgi:MoaA/NifB/PqqE/SkfB family radical SAM enzyme